MIYKYILEKKAVASAHKTEIQHTLLIIAACCAFGFFHLFRIGEFSEDMEYTTVGYEEATVEYARPRESAIKLKMILHIVRNDGTPLVLTTGNPNLFAMNGDSVCLERSSSPKTEKDSFKLTYLRHCIQGENV